MELTGFEPVTPSLRKMRSKRSDQGKRRALRVSWGGCGANEVRQRKTCQGDPTSLPEQEHETRHDEPHRPGDVGDRDDCARELPALLLEAADELERSDDEE